MINQTTDYDQRQINIMQHKINAYREDEIRLLYLINDLESLCNLLESISSNWKKRFFLNWEILEINYAVASSGERELNEDEIKRVDEAINNIEKLIQEVNS